MPEGDFSKVQEWQNNYIKSLSDDSSSGNVKIIYIVGIIVFLVVVVWTGVLVWRSWGKKSVDLVEMFRKKSNQVRPRSGIQVCDNSSDSESYSSSYSSSSKHSTGHNKYTDDFSPKI